MQCFGGLAAQRCNTFIQGNNMSVMAPAALLTLSPSALLWRCCFGSMGGGVYRFQATVSELVRAVDGNIEAVEMLNNNMKSFIQSVST